MSASWRSLSVLACLVFAFVYWDVWLSDCPCADDNSCDGEMGKWRPASPRLFDVSREAMRLNELLAQNQYTCKNPVALLAQPADADRNICLDLNELSRRDRFVILDTSGNLDPHLLRNNNFTQLFVFTLSATARNETFRGDADTFTVNVEALRGSLVPQKEEHSTNSDVATFSIGSLVRLIHERLKGSCLVDVLRVNCNSATVHRPKTSSAAASSCIAILNDVIANGHLFTQLQLTFDFDNSSNDLVYEWYRLLSNLFYAGSWALFAAAQFGNCGRSLGHCRYELSFVCLKSRPDLPVLAPIMGLGSPTEEYDRLISYMSTKQMSCPHTLALLNLSSIFYSNSDIRNDLLWTLCIQYYESRGTSADVVINSAKLLEADTMPAAFKTIEVKHVDGIGTSKVVVLDLITTDWDVLESVLTDNALSDTLQLVMRVHIWYGEENHNYRLYCSLLWRLHESGFRLFYYRAFESLSFDAGHELGWIRISKVIIDLYK